MFLPVQFSLGLLLWKAGCIFFQKFFCIYCVIFEVHFCDSSHPSQSECLWKTNQNLVTNAGKIREKEEPSFLLGRLQTGAGTLEDRVKNSQKAKIYHITQLYFLTYDQRTQHLIPQITDQQGSYLLYSQQLGCGNKLNAFHWKVDNKNVIHKHYEILFNCENNKIIKFTINGWNLKKIILR